MKYDRIEIHIYELNPIKPLNAQAQSQTRKGAFVKVCRGQLYGVGDLMPWPELGDSNLESEIKQKGPLFQRALEWADFDLQARENKVSLLTPQEIKIYENLSFESLKQIIDSSEKQPQRIPEIKDIKLKLNSNYEPFLKWWNANNNINFFVRLDFNSSLNSEQALDFFTKINKTRNILYVEDPCPFINDVYKKLNHLIPIAIDFEKPDQSFQSDPVWTYKIFKPNRENSASFQKLNNNKVIITSQMDHIVGHFIAFHEASKLNSDQAFGLSTFNHYKELSELKAFTTQYKKPNDSNGPCESFLKISDSFIYESQKSYGWGLNTYLDSLNWQVLREGH